MHFRCAVVVAGALVLAGCASSYKGPQFTACYEGPVRSLRLFRLATAEDLPHLGAGTVPFMLEQTKEYANAQQQIRAEVGATVDSRLDRINRGEFNVIYVSLSGAKWLAITPVLPIIQRLVPVPPEAAFAMWRPPPVGKALLYKILHAKPDDCVYLFDRDARLLGECREGADYSNPGGAGNLHTRFHDYVRVPRIECGSKQRN